MTDCLFCQIARKEKPSDLVEEDERFIAFKDIRPKAPVHVLVVPKQHISSVADLEVEHRELMGDLVLFAKQVASRLNLPGYKLQFNVGRAGGQIVDHLHLHLLGNPEGRIPGTFV